MEYVNCEVSIIIDTEDNHELTAEELTDKLNEYDKENKALKKQIESEHVMLDNAILLERTRMGKNCLKQFKEAIK
jgi:hypothetical protein